MGSPAPEATSTVDKNMAERIRDAEQRAIHPGDWLASNPIPETHNLPADDPLVVWAEKFKKAFPGCSSSK